MEEGKLEEQADEETKYDHSSLASPHLKDADAPPAAEAPPPFSNDGNVKLHREPAVVIAGVLPMYKDQVHGRAADGVVLPSYKDQACSYEQQ